MAHGTSGGGCMHSMMTQRAAVAGWLHRFMFQHLRAVPQPAVTSIYMCKSRLYHYRPYWWCQIPVLIPVQITLVFRYYRNWYCIVLMLQFAAPDFWRTNFTVHMWMPNGSSLWISTTDLISWAASQLILASSHSFAHSCMSMSLSSSAHAS